MVVGAGVYRCVGVGVCVSVWSPVGAMKAPAFSSDDSFITTKPFEQMCNSSRIWVLLLPR